MSALSVRSAGDSHRGAIRDNNEDALIVDPKWGLYAVLDGMGGAAFGDVASNKARDVIHEYVRARRNVLAARPLLEAAINAASAAVHGEAQQRRDRKGMGTTVVACLLDGRRATIAHVGDSRAYLLRDGRLHRLTNDHTIVAELVARGAIQPHEAEHHAYKNVLSRNLGSKPVAHPDVSEVDLQPGDRLMLCSDGLYGYASTDSVHHLVASTDPPADVVRDLIEAALRGGGGDNVTAIVIEAGVAVVPRATTILRTTGAGAWWARRDRFLAACRALGVHKSPLCAVLRPEEAITIVAGNFADAVYHDLEKVTGVNVWTYAENVARGWLGQGGGWPPLRDLLDGLARAADLVMAELRAEDGGLAALLEIAVARAIVTAETAVGGVLAERLRAIEGELVRVDAEQTQRHQSGRVEASKFQESATIPYQRGPAATSEVPAPEVAALLESARRRVLPPTATGDPTLFARAVEHAHRVATATGGDAGDAAIASRELWDVRSLDEAGVSPLFDALDLGRRAHIDAVRATTAVAPAKAAAMRRLTAAYQRLSSGIATLVVGSVAPAAEQLREVVRETARLRGQVSQNEARIAELEQKLATVVDAAGGPPGRGPDGTDRPKPRRRVTKETQRS